MIGTVVAIPKEIKTLPKRATGRSVFRAFRMAGKLFRAHLPQILDELSVFIPTQQGFERNR